MDPLDAAAADVSAAISLVATGHARSVTVAGLVDAAAVAAQLSVAAAHASVVLDVAPPRLGGTAPSAVRIRPAVIALEPERRRSFHWPRLYGTSAITVCSRPTSTAFRRLAVWL
jgi:hypothetical protein